MVTGWFGSLGADRVAVDIDILGVTVAQELAVGVPRGVAAADNEAGWRSSLANLAALLEAGWNEGDTVQLGSSGHTADEHH
jgi:hypothetical protein